jgi:hypothetical protein
MRSVESLLSAVAAALEEQIDDLVEEMLARMRAEVRDFAALEQPELDDATRHSCYANVRAALAGLRGDRVTAAVAPVEAEDNARRAARLGVELPQLLQTYRVGHAVAWERILTFVDSLDAEPEVRNEILRLASRYAFGYIDAVIPTAARRARRRADRRRRARL